MSKTRINVAVLRIKHKWCPFSANSEKFPEIYAYTFSQLKFSDERNKFLCKIIGDDKERQKYIHAFKTHPLVRELELISSVKDTSVMSAVVNYPKNKKSVKSLIENLGCYHADVVTFKGGFEEWVIYNKDPSVIENVINTLINERCEVKLVKTYPLDSWEDSVEHIGLREISDSLTPRQKYAFKVAYSMGYYDGIRKVSLDQVAKQLKMSKPAVWKHLHKVEEKIMKMASELIR